MYDEDRLAAYYHKTADQRAADPREFEARFLHGVTVRERALNRPSCRPEPAIAPPERKPVTLRQVRA